MQKYRGTMKRDRSLTSEESTDCRISENMPTSDFRFEKILPASSKDLRQSIRLSLQSSTSVDHNSVSHLLEECADFLYQSSYAHCLSRAEIVLDRAWEKLNSFHWKDVPVRWQILYSFACLFKACSLGAEVKSTEDLKEICRVCDMGLLMGFDIMDGVLHNIISMFKPPISKVRMSCQRNDDTSFNEEQLTHISKLSTPSMEVFTGKMKLGSPFIVKNCMDHWPARGLWSFEYLNETAGHRLVPVELGAKYTDDTWGQNLMTISNFIQNYIVARESKPKAYLAQHRLFDQIPALRNDIYIPDYCSISRLENCNPETDTEINAWFGPRGTVSPCHYDIKHNLLAQVVGKKYVRLYGRNCDYGLYPRDGLMNNTSAVDVENADNEQFPLFSEMDKIHREECILHPGEMLYIPPQYWHYVRSLDESFSVSFWWV